MKKNTIKFWIRNRFVAMMFVWIAFDFLMSDNPYINAVILTILFFGSLFLMVHLIEENKTNSSERLMWAKWCSLLK